MSPDTAKCPLVAKVPLAENHWLKGRSRTFSKWRIKKENSRWKEQPKYRQVQGGAKRLGCMVGGNGKL